MSPREDQLCLQQMADYARTIEKELAEVSRNDFDDDPRLQSRIILLLQNIGEAARNVSGPLKDAHPEIDWPKIVGMRHHLVHGYDRIDFDIVWLTATDRVGSLISALENLLL